LRARCWEGQHGRMAIRPSYERGVGKASPGVWPYAPTAAGFVEVVQDFRRLTCDAHHLGFGGV
ncbi:MAG: hypothetical protein RBU37_28445, partial [Myxococcota bacterium]|nr:hypothetical protein [Myxococcota bacterium]